MASISKAKIGAIALATSIVWLAVTVYGELMNGAPNSACYPMLGCDSGFFGYDALEHFLFGIAAVWILVWAFKQFPRISVLHPTFYKSAFTLLSIIALIAVLWEIGECFRDAYLLDIAHVQLLNLKLHINYLSQPSNFDTMGDLTFTLVGALLSFVPLRWLSFRRSLTGRTRGAS